MGVLLKSFKILGALVLGVVVLIVVAFPKGIVGVIETLRLRYWRAAPQPAVLASRIESAE